MEISSIIRELISAGYTADAIEVLFVAYGKNEKLFKKMLDKYLKNAKIKM